VITRASGTFTAARNITLVVQDWGGTLGLTLPVDAGLRSKLDWLFVMNTIPPVRRVTPQLSDEEMTAYDAPFLDSRFNAGRSHVS
jgi:haloalkane dehalogenase